MTEKEKMERGLLYDANYDEALLAEQLAAKDLCHAFNQLKPCDETAQYELLRQLLGGIGKRCIIRAPFFCDYGSRITVGENFYCNHNCVILDGGGVSFGDNVFIAPNCGFYTAGHPENIEKRNAGLEYARPICIGSNVWIGAQTAVLPGITIGDGSIIGAASVVTHDIPSGVVAAGNPCRVLRPVDPSR